MVDEEEVEGSEFEENAVGTENGENDEETTESEEAEDDERNIIDPDDFPTLELTLEEARRQYDDEERRRAAVENKIGIVVTVDALLISFGALLGPDLHPFILVSVMAPALLSAGLGLWAIRSRDYERPGKDIWDFHNYSEFNDDNNQREQLLLDYETTTGGNKNKNDPKFSQFNWCIFLTFISFVLLLATPVTQHFGIYDWLLKLAKGVADCLGEVAQNWGPDGQSEVPSNNTTMNNTTSN